MALRDQPYLPLYVQDYLTDEKLNNCSWTTQGIYIKIICVLHKQEEYGTILFKQNSKQEFKQIDKQNFSMCFNFASMLVKQIPCQLDEMENAIIELVENKVLIIDGDKLMQKRMVKDNSVSEARSKAAKKGGGNPILFKQNSKQEFKQIDKQNPEYEYEYEIENNNSDFILKNENEKIENLKNEIENEKIKIESAKRYYRSELENANQEDKNYTAYKVFVDFICNPENQTETLLTVNQQVNFMQFSELRTISLNKGKTIKEIVEYFVNTPDKLNGKRSLYLSIKSLLNYNNK